MIFRSALRKELFSTGSAVFMTLLSIMITVMLIRILGQAAAGKIASEDVIALIGFATLNYFSIILILTGFVTVLLVFTRSYQDSEMVVWFASGLSLTQWVRTVLGFATPIIILTTIMSFFITPWANQQSTEFRERFQKRSDIARIAPGTFQESSNGSRIFFVEGLSGDLNKVKNIFIHSQKGLLLMPKINIVLAKEGTVKTNKKGEKFLILENGMHYDMKHDQSDMQITKFKRYETFLSQSSEDIQIGNSVGAKTTAELLKNPNKANLGEILWRISLPIMALLLILLGIPLSAVNPRIGRSANLIVAVLIYIAYNNIMSFSQASVAQGKVSFSLAWWPMHLLVACIVIILFLIRLNVNNPYHPSVLFSRFKHKTTKKLKDES